MGVRVYSCRVMLPIVIGLNIVLSVVLNSCTKPAPVSTQRLDQALFACHSRTDVVAFLTAHTGVAQLYFNANNPAADTTLVNDLTRRLQNPELRVLYDQTQAEFGDAQPLTSQLAEAFDNIKRDYPTFKPPRVATFVTGFLGPDLLVSDSLILIGLDYFVGPAATYRPRGEEFPRYVLRRYAQPYLIPTIVRMLATRFNEQNPADQTLLADMVYTGKSMVFTRSILPQTPDSLIIGYSDRQLTETFNAQEQVWAHFVDNQLLYQTNAEIKKRYTGERPYTVEIGNRCPGRIGDWLGWQIVSRYFDQKKLSIPELMRQTDARSLFQQSGFRAQKETL